MGRITEECVARIKDAVDIVDLVGRYVQLRRAGTAWKACCPFHNEKTPSFHVNPARQSFHCFGCGVGGDAARFLMMFENLDFPTALRRLADIYGIAVIEEEESPELARRRRARSTASCTTAFSVRAGSLRPARRASSRRCSSALVAPSYSASMASRKARVCRASASMPAMPEKADSAISSSATFFLLLRVDKESLLETI